MSSRMKAVIAGAAVGLALAGTAAVFLNSAAASSKSTSASGEPRLSALGSPTLPTVAAEVVGKLLSLHPDGSFVDARETVPGLYAATYDGSVCDVDSGRGIETCTNDFPGGVHFVGSVERQWDSPSAPYQMNFDGLAVDGIAAITVTTKTGGTQSVPVKNNGFSATLLNTTPDDIQSLGAVWIDGTTTALDPAEYFPSNAEIGGGWPGEGREGPLGPTQTAETLEGWRRRSVAAPDSSMHAAVRSSRLTCSVSRSPGRP